MSRLVFITGASSGLGQALAGRYYAAGYRLALAARRTASVHTWAEKHQLAVARLQIYSADVSNLESIAAAGAACIATQGVPDVVVANAGISIGMDSAIRSDLDVMSNTFATNVVGAAATFHPFLCEMKRRGSGTLVGIGSVAGIRGLPGHGAYCASKAGLISYCESLRGELRSDGIKVVTICPGYIDTPLTRKNRYAMPFLMHPDQFAERAYEAVCAGASYRVIPWQMAFVAKGLRLLPNLLFDRLLSGRPRKARQPE